MGYASGSLRIKPPGKVLDESLSFLLRRSLLVCLRRLTIRTADYWHSKNSQLLVFLTMSAAVTHYL